MKVMRTIVWKPGTTTTKAKGFFLNLLSCSWGFLVKLKFVSSKSNCHCFRTQAHLFCNFISYFCQKRYATVRNSFKSSPSKREVCQKMLSNFNKCHIASFYEQMPCMSHLFSKSNNTEEEIDCD